MGDSGPATSVGVAASPSAKDGKGFGHTDLVTC